MLGRVDSIFISVLILCSGCSPQDEIELPEHIRNLENLTVYEANEVTPFQIQLQRDQLYGEEDGVLFGSRIMDMAVDEEGCVYIADSEKEIKVFEAEGEYVTTLGREGDGPGEFKNIVNLQIEGNQLYAHDMTQQRVTVFSLEDLTYKTTVNIADNRMLIGELNDSYPSRYHVTSDGNFLIAFSYSDVTEGLRDWDRIGYSNQYYLLNQEGRITSYKLFDLRSRSEVIVPVGGLSVGRSIGFYGRLVMGLTNNDHVLTAWTEDMLVSNHSINGEYQRSFYYPFERVPLTQASASNAGIAEFILEGFSSMQAPEHWPSLSSLLVDDENRIWISTIVDNHEIYEWWVLQETGEMITRFEWPRDKSVQEIKNGYLYSLERTDSEELFIARYKIDLDEV